MWDAIALAGTLEDRYAVGWRAEDELACHSKAAEQLGADRSGTYDRCGRRRAMSAAANRRIEASKLFLWHDPIGPVGGHLRKRSGRVVACLKCGDGGIQRRTESTPRCRASHRRKYFATPGGSPIGTRRAARSRIRAASGGHQRLRRSLERWFM